MERLVKMKKNRKFTQITLSEAKQVLLLELAFEREDKPTKIKLDSKSRFGYSFIVSWEKWADSREGFSFDSKKCFKTYEYLLSRGFKL